MASSEARCLGLHDLTFQWVAKAAHFKFSSDSLPTSSQLKVRDRISMRSYISHGMVGCDVLQMAMVDELAALYNKVIDIRIAQNKQENEKQCDR